MNSINKLWDNAEQPIKHVIVVSPEKENMYRKIFEEIVALLNGSY